MNSRLGEKKLVGCEYIQEYGISSTQLVNRYNKWCTDTFGTNKSAYCQLSCGICSTYSGGRSAGACQGDVVDYTFFVFSSIDGGFKTCPWIDEENISIDELRERIKFFCVDKVTVGEKCCASCNNAQNRLDGNENITTQPQGSPSRATSQPTLAPSFQLTFQPTFQPTTKQPITSQPTTSQPTTIQPTTIQPTTIQPTTSQPTTSQPTTSQPTTSQPTTSQPTTSQPTTMQPTQLQGSPSRVTYPPTFSPTFSPTMQLTSQPATQPVFQPQTVTVNPTKAYLKHSNSPSTPPTHFPTKTPTFICITNPKGKTRVNMAFSFVLPVPAYHIDDFRKMLCTYFHNGDTKITKLKYCK